MIYLWKVVCPSTPFLSTWGTVSLEKVHTLLELNTLPIRQTGYINAEPPPISFLANIQVINASKCAGLELLNC